MHTNDLFDPINTYFNTPALKGLMQQLHHLAFFGDGISLVQGNRGSGKTQLIQALSSQFEDANAFFHIEIKEDNELGDSIRQIAIALGLLKNEDLSVGELLSQLRHYSQSLVNDKKMSVVCVDDAQHLDEQSIGALLSLLQGNTDNNYGLHLILFALPGLDKRIDALQIIDVPVYDFPMPNFSVTELAEFVQRELHLVEIDKARIQQVWSITKGNPGKALELYQAKDKRNSNQASEAEEKQESQENDASNKSFISRFMLPFGHLAAIVVLAGILIWSVIFTSSEDDSEPLSEDLSQQSTQKENRQNTEEKNPKQAYREKSSLEISDANQKDTSIIESSELTNVARPKDNSSILDKQEKPQTISTPVISPAIKTNIKVPDLKQAEALPQQNKENITVAKNNVKIDSKDYSEESAESKASKASKENSKNAEPRVDEIQERKATSDERFLLSQSAESYTLQVLAASKYSSMQRYIERQPNKDKLYMYRGTREGKSWYVVVADVYPSRQAALSARKKLPQEQVNAGPWPRKLSAVQEEINNYLQNN